MRNPLRHLVTVLAFLSIYSLSFLVYYLVQYFPSLKWLVLVYCIAVIGIIVFSRITYKRIRFKRASPLSEAEQLEKNWYLSDKCRAPGFPRDNYHRNRGRL